MQFSWPEYFQVLGLLAAIVCSRGLSKFKISGFILLLLLTCLTDLIGGNYARFGWKDNYFIYNIYIIISFPVAYYIFNNMLSYSGLIKVVFVSIGALIFSFVILNAFFLQGINKFDTYSLILTEFAYVFISLLVLIELFKEDDFSIMLYNHPYFWISGATLLFSATTLVILGLQQYIQVQKLQIHGENIYRIIEPIMNIVLYLSYSYAFFLCYKITSKLSRQ